MTAETISQLQTFLTTSFLAFAFNFLAAILILVAGWWISGWASRAVGMAADRSGRVDATLRPLAVSLVRYVVLAITLLAVLGRFGVQTTSIVAIFGAAGLAIGLALQGTLSNVAAGVMLLVLRPFRVGDVIQVTGNTGTVLQIGLFTTELTTPDNLFVSMPNSSVWNTAIINFTRNPTRRIDLTVGIGYDDDVDVAIGLVHAVLGEEGRVLADPAPMVGVRALGESSVDLVIRCHTATADYQPTLFALHKAIKQRFDAEGITIPYPQRTVHVAAGVAVPS